MAKFHPDFHRTKVINISGDMIIGDRSSVNVSVEIDALGQIYDRREQ